MTRSKRFDKTSPDRKDVMIDIMSSELHRRREITFAYLFGSATNSEDFRDLDVAIYLSSEPPDSLDYCIKLALLLESRLEKSVDVVMLNSAPDHLIYEISKGMLIKDEDDNLRVDFITASWSRYLDFKDKRIAFVREAFAERSKD